MAEKPAAKMAICKSEKNNSELKLFKWSFRPILFWMNLLGIPLTLSSGGLVKFSFIFVYSILLFGKETGINIFSVTKLFLEGDSLFSSNVASSTVKWNIYINQLNHTITTFGTHFALMFFALVQWQNLVEVLEYLEKTNFFEQKDYNKFNRICWCGLSLVILVTIVISLNNYLKLHLICTVTF